MRAFALGVSLALVAGLIAAFGTAAPTTVTAQTSPGQLRAYWVDAFGEGIFNEAEIDKLVAETKRANLNAIVVQVGRRADCFCNRASMPRTQAAIAPLPFDPLDTLLAKARAQGIEVHAWIITTAMWNSATAPRDARHAFNTNGPSAENTPGYWLGVRYDGALRESTSASANWFFDPGHPAAAQYIVDMYLSVAREYGVDGLHFDRVRYPDLQLAQWPNDNAWGYNPTALARFHALTGRTDRPLPNDPQWSQWRRDQITGIVRKVYLETFAIRPSVRISAATVTYGNITSWTDSRPYRETLQDWRGWMEEGIVDLNVPMNYKREHLEDQRAWYDNWNAFAKDHAYGRQVAIGPALYLNDIDDSVAQARRALAPSPAGNPSSGWVGYSYRTPDDVTREDTTKRDQQRAELTRALTEPSWYDPVTPPVFASSAAVPRMPWKDTPTRGHVRGTLQSAAGTPVDQARVALVDAAGLEVRSAWTDGTGWFGFVDVAPGEYRVVAGEASARVVVSAGSLATASLRR